MKKKALLIILTTAMIGLFGIQANAAIDMSVFENNPDLYEIEIDDFDDTGTIELTVDEEEIFGNVWPFFVEDPYISDNLYAYFDIRIIDEGELAVPRLVLYYVGKDWIFIDKVILKGYEARFTFEVDSSTDTSDGKVYETMTLVLGNNGIQLMEEIKKECEYHKVLYADIKEENPEQYENIIKRVTLNGRLSGSDGERDFQMSIERADKILQMYDDFIAAGGLEQDLSFIDENYPCVIKELD